MLPKLESLPNGINERLVTLRIKLKENQHLTFVSVYAQTLTIDELIKKQFYEELDNVIRNTPASGKLLVVEDFNARVGSNASNWTGVLGLHGVRKENSNVVLLLSKCAQHQLAIWQWSSLISVLRQWHVVQAKGQIHDYLATP